MKGWRGGTEAEVEALASCICKGVWKAALNANTRPWLIESEWVNKPSSYPLYFSLPSMSNLRTPLEPQRFKSFRNSGGSLDGSSMALHILHQLLEKLDKAWPNPHLPNGRSPTCQMPKSRVTENILPREGKIHQRCKTLRDHQHPHMRCIVWNSDQCLNLFLVLFCDSLLISIYIYIYIIYIVTQYYYIILMY